MKSAEKGTLDQPHNPIEKEGKKKRKITSI